MPNKAKRTKKAKPERSNQVDPLYKKAYLAISARVAKVRPVISRIVELRRKRAKKAHKAAHALYLHYLRTNSVEEFIHLVETAQQFPELYSDIQLAALGVERPKPIRNNVSPHHPRGDTVNHMGKNSFYPVGQVQATLGSLRNDIAQNAISSAARMAVEQPDLVRYQAHNISIHSQCSAPAVGGNFATEDATTIFTRWINANEVLSGTTVTFTQPKWLDMMDPAQCAQWNQGDTNYRLKFVGDALMTKIPFDQQLAHSVAALFQSQLNRYDNSALFTIGHIIVQQLIDFEERGIAPQLQNQRPNGVQILPISIHAQAIANHQSIVDGLAQGRFYIEGHFLDDADIQAMYLISAGPSSIVSAARHPNHVMSSVTTPPVWFGVLQPGQNVRDAPDFQPVSSAQMRATLTKLANILREPAANTKGYVRACTIINGQVGEVPPVPEQPAPVQDDLANELRILQNNIDDIQGMDPQELADNWPPPPPAQPAAPPRGAAPAQDAPVDAAQVNAGLDMADNLAALAQQLGRLRANAARRDRLAAIAIRGMQEAPQPRRPPVNCDEYALNMYRRAVCAEAQNQLMVALFNDLQAVRAEQVRQEAIAREAPAGLPNPVPSNPVGLRFSAARNALGQHPNPNEYAAAGGVLHPQRLIWYCSTLETRVLTLPRPMAHNFMWRLLEVETPHALQQNFAADVQALDNLHGRAQVYTGSVMAGCFSLGVSTVFNLLNITGRELNSMGYQPGVTTHASSLLANLTSSTAEGCPLWKAAAHSTSQITGINFNPDSLVSSNWCMGLINQPHWTPQDVWQGTWPHTVPYLIDPLSLSAAIRAYPDIWGISDPRYEIDISTDLITHGTAERRALDLQRGTTAYQQAGSSTRPYLYVPYGINTITGIIQHVQWPDQPYIQYIPLQRANGIAVPAAPRDGPQPAFDPVLLYLRPGTLLTYDWVEQAVLAPIIRAEQNEPAWWAVLAPLTNRVQTTLGGILRPHATLVELIDLDVMRLIGLNQGPAEAAPAANNQAENMLGPV